MITEEQKNYLHKMQSKTDEEFIAHITAMGDAIGNMRYYLSSIGVDLAMDCIDIIEQKCPQQSRIGELLRCFAKYDLECHHLDSIHEYFVGWCVSRGYVNVSILQRREIFKPDTSNPNDRVVAKILSVLFFVVLIATLCLYYAVSNL